MGGDDIDPNFTFDFDSGEHIPWELSGAISELDVPSRKSALTTLDEKINRRIRGKVNQRSANTYDSSDDDESTQDSYSGGDESEGEEYREDESDGSDTEMQDLEKRRTKGKACVEGVASARERGPNSSSRSEPLASQGNDSFFSATPSDVAFSAPSFEEMNLSRQLVKACATLGYMQPTPIQAACIPLGLLGRDICGSAITGSGKTGAFGLPILERLMYRSRKVSAIYALILTPTRELAVQVQSMMQKLAQFTDIRTALVVGGLSLQVQATTLRSNPEVVVATPGRLIDHLRNTQSVDIDDLQALVLDEADRLLEMGFFEEIKEVIRLAPRKRQTMLFSATMTDEVKTLAALSLQKPIRLAADAKYAAPAQLVQEVIRVKGGNTGRKEAILLALCSKGVRDGRTIIFFRTKKSAHRAKMLFGLAGLRQAAELHGNMTQTMRLESLEKFRKGEVAFLLATDVASRGLDILGVDTVVSYDSPSSIAAYLHRIGRTARAGKDGRSITFVEDGDRKLMKQIIKQQRVSLQERVISTANIRTWAAKIESLEPDVRRLEEEEREEMQLRKAEMVMAKAENMVEHEAEIYSRPARTWFQTASQKKNALDSSFRNQNKAGEKHAQKRARGREVEQGKGRKKAKLMEETASASKAIRAVKSNEKQLREQGIAPTQARKIALGKVASKSPSKGKKTKSNKSDSTAFEGSGLPSRTPSKVYAGGRRSISAASAGKRQEKNNVKRGGKGRNAFKSKARHKRR